MSERPQQNVCGKLLAYHILAMILGSIAAVYFVAMYKVITWMMA